MIRFVFAIIAVCLLAVPSVACDALGVMGQRACVQSVQAYAAPVVQYQAVAPVVQYQVQRQCVQPQVFKQRVVQKQLVQKQVVQKVVQPVVVKQKVIQRQRLRLRLFNRH